MFLQFIIALCLFCIVFSQDLTSSIRDEINQLQSQQQELIRAGKYSEMRDVTEQIKGKFQEMRDAIRSDHAVTMNNFEQERSDATARASASVANLHSESKIRTSSVHDSVPAKSDFIPPSTRSVGSSSTDSFHSMIKERVDDMLKKIDESSMSADEAAALKAEVNEYHDLEVKSINSRSDMMAEMDAASKISDPTERRQHMDQARANLDIKREEEKTLRETLNAKRTKVIKEVAEKTMPAPMKDRSVNMESQEHGRSVDAQDSVINWSSESSKKSKRSNGMAEKFADINKDDHMQTMIQSRVDDMLKRIDSSSSLSTEEADGLKAEVKVYHELELKALNSRSSIVTDMETASTITDATERKKVMDIARQQSELNREEEKTLRMQVNEKRSSLLKSIAEKTRPALSVNDRSVKKA